MSITIDGTDIKEVTIDGTKVKEITMDGDIVWRSLFLFSGSQDNTVRKLTLEGEEIWSFTGHTESIYSLVVEPNGYVYSGEYESQLIKISPEGNQIWLYDNFTENIDNVAVNNNGYVFATGRNPDNELRKIDSNGNLVWKYINWDYSVTGLAVDTNGNIYVGVLDGFVEKTNSSGTKIWQFSNNDNISNVDDVKVGVNGYVYCFALNFDDTEVIYKLDSNGNNIWSLDVTDSNPHYDMFFEIDEEDSIYLISYDKIIKYDSNKNLLWSTTINSGIQINAITVDIDHNVYIGDNSNAVIKLDESGNELWRFTGHTNNVESLAVMPGKCGAFPTEW